MVEVRSGGELDEGLPVSDKVRESEEEHGIQSVEPSHLKNEGTRDLSSVADDLQKTP